MSQDKVAILCKKVKDLADPGPGASRGNCWTCGVEVWISPNSRRRMREFQATLYCNDCGIEIMKKEQHAVVGTPSQMAQFNEIVKEKMGGEISPMGVTDDPDEFMRKVMRRRDDAERP